MKGKRIYTWLGRMALIALLCSWGWEDIDTGWGNYSLDPGPHDNNYDLNKEGHREIKCKNRNTAGDLRFYLLDANGNILEVITLEPDETGHLDVPKNYNGDELIVQVAYEYQPGHWAAFNEWSYPYPVPPAPPK